MRLERVEVKKVKRSTLDYSRVIDQFLRSRNECVRIINEGEFDNPMSMYNAFYQAVKRNYYGIVKVKKAGNDVLLYKIDK